MGFTIQHTIQAWRWNRSYGKVGTWGKYGQENDPFFKCMEANPDLKRYIGHRGGQVKWKIQGSIYMSNIKNTVNMDIEISRTTVRIVSLCAFVPHLI